LGDDVQRKLAARLAEFTHGDKAQPVVFLLLQDVLAVA
jgi:hypothetical protein